MGIEFLPGSLPDVDTMSAKVREDYPAAKRGIIIVFDDDGVMHTHYSCSEQQMAMASVRLAYLSCRD